MQLDKLLGKRLLENKSNSESDVEEESHNTKSKMRHTNNTGFKHKYYAQNDDPETFQDCLQQLAEVIEREKANNTKSSGLNVDPQFLSQGGIRDSWDL